MEAQIFSGLMKYGANYGEARHLGKQGNIQSLVS
jgi:hypothetical protein